MEKSKTINKSLGSKLLLHLCPSPLKWTSNLEGVYYQVIMKMDLYHIFPHTWNFTILYISSINEMETRHTQPSRITGTYQKFDRRTMQWMEKGS